ncbi:MAG: hypothetical protein JWN38_32 [Candidatus Saccharibacteria bacterium]|nr:hypothetical protein [Candidatus Saccharibacteria bacterium]
MKHNLPEDYALVLQQINDDGGDDFSTLSEALRYDRSRLLHIVQALHHKGLITVQSTGFSEVWLGVSHKGRRLISYLWPDSRLQFQA